ncbi:MAG: hypothetical protein GF381_02515 [Candidatus Pacebacteria bacterium]|nr:hypothetical protein [Candidatus Paceibacterota bacterium]
MKKYLNLLLIVALIITGIYFAGQQGWLRGTPLEKLDYQKLNFFSQETTQQTKVLTSRAKKTGEHVQKVLGDNIEATEESQNKPLHERTIEYARYLYCKQVVESYEQEK